MTRTKARSASTSKKLKELDRIVVRGAREHNLKDIHLEIPKKSFVVITGVSGSGKSSLAFDTLFAEGQRRYVESLSAYARQFLGQMERPKYETISGLSPTISIEQKAASKNPRSTVGTITEVYDYLRVFFARVGVQHCIKCDKKVGRGDANSMVEQILDLPQDTRILILTPIIENRKGEHRDRLQQLRQESFTKVRIDGVVRELEDVQALAKNKKHNIEAVVGRLKVNTSAQMKKRVTDYVETALKWGQGKVIIHIDGREDIPMSEARSCCGLAYPELTPQLFSFNSPLGMCEGCQGLGSVIDVDVGKIIPDPNLSIRKGAVIPWKNYFHASGAEKDHWGMERILAMVEQWGLDLDRPWKSLPKRLSEKILYGPRGECGGKKYKTELSLQWQDERGNTGTYVTNYEGLLPKMMRLYKTAQSEGRRSWITPYLSSTPCAQCKGLRLRKEANAVKVQKLSLHDYTTMSIGDLHQHLKELKLKGNQLVIASELLKEIRARVGFLVNVGLNYLSLSRQGPTLSGGEAQRIRLAGQIGSELTGVLYILDEPSIGLHQRDNNKLLKTLCYLRDIGNTLLVVEHDEETMEMADWIIDMGPGAGHLGGQIVAQGTPAQLKKNKHSLTGQYLAQKLKIEVPTERRKYKGRGVEVEWLVIEGMKANNLKNVDGRIPLGLFTCVTGVSGAGKSTFINQICHPALARHLNNSTEEVGEYRSISGLESIDKVINIDQRPIGRTPRSNPATYTKVFDLVRDLFALLPESAARGYKKGRFSFNVKGGRCENCQGDGSITVEMHFLADVLVPCEVCKGQRFNSATLEVKFKGHSIADCLQLSVLQARELFQNHPKIVKILDTLIAVGLSYIKLGQAATTMSGGEAQRVKLSRELAKRDTGNTFYILDEPTTGLHFEDIRKLLKVLQQLTDAGNTVVVIEHNLDVIKCADYIIDMGPEGGASGGKIIAEGGPEEVAKKGKTPTAQFLRPKLKA